MTDPLAAFEESMAEWDAEMAPDAEALRRLYAEAGYPDAHVYIDWTGIFTEGVPDDVVERAWAIINACPPDALTP